MKIIHEYTTVDKSAWGRGEWNDEPDKLQGIDEATGLDCLIVRNRGGALCGYVGIPASHPWFGKDYNQCTHPVPCGESFCDHTPGGALSVHGGVTFADACHDATHERWEQLRASFPAWEAEAAKYPKGDAAERIKTMAACRDNYDAYAKYLESAAVCHVPQDGASDRVWWFGFDCAHYGDVSPKYDRDRCGRGFGESYKSRHYVEGEIAQLAQQLAAAQS